MRTNRRRSSELTITWKPWAIRQKPEAVLKTLMVRLGRRHTGWTAYQAHLSSQELGPVDDQTPVIAQDRHAAGTPQLVKELGRPATMGRCPQSRAF